MSCATLAFVAFAIEPDHIGRGFLQAFQGIPEFQDFGALSGRFGYFSGNLSRLLRIRSSYRRVSACVWAITGMFQGIMGRMLGNWKQEL
jgi:hypothetical protein